MYDIVGTLEIPLFDIPIIFSCVRKNKCPEITVVVMMDYGLILINLKIIILFLTVTPRMYYQNVFSLNFGLFIKIQKF